MLSRRRFLELTAASGITAGVGAALPLTTRLDTAHADPELDLYLVGSLAQAVNIRASVCGDTSLECLTPRLLNNGMYALPQSALREDPYAAAADGLADWKRVRIDPADFSRQVDGDDSSEFLLAVDGKVMRQAGRPGAMTMPRDGVFRFEVQPDDFAGSYDVNSGSRRSEIIARQRDGTGVGTVWSSFSLVLGEQTDLSAAGRGIVHQWHSVDKDVGRTPVLFVDVANSKLTVRTCSSARLYGSDAERSQSPESGVQVVHYSAGQPRAGELTHITMQATFGKNGHLRVWIDGRNVVDTDTPIGYYADLKDQSGRTILGYPHWGLYTTNRPNTQIVYIANPEWGTGTLADRVSEPLPVPGFD